MTLTDKINLAVAIASGLVALATLALAWATYQSNATLKKQHEAAQRPFIKAHVWAESNSAMMLTIANEGNNTAEDLVLTLDRDYFMNGGSSGRNLRSYPAFSKQIKAMPGKTSLQFMLGVGHRVLDPQVAPQEFSLNAKYRSGKSEYSETLHIDLEPFRGVALITNPTIEALGKLTTAIGALQTKLG